MLIPKTISFLFFGVSLLGFLFFIALNVLFPFILSYFLKVFFANNCGANFIFSSFFYSIRFILCYLSRILISFLSFIFLRVILIFLLFNLFSNEPSVVIVLFQSPIRSLEKNNPSNKKKSEKKIVLWVKFRIFKNFSFNFISTDMTKSTFKLTILIPFINFF